MSVADAVLALAKAAVAPVVVYDGKVPDAPADRYVVLYSDPGTRFSETVTATSDLTRVRFQLTYVGRGLQAARPVVESLAEKCRNALLDVTPTMAGWQFGPIQHEGSRPLDVDPDDPSAIVLSFADSFVLLGSRA